MPFNIGPGELIIVLIIALIVVGPGKLPDVGAAIGKSLREFRRAASDVNDATAPPPATPSGQGRVTPPPPAASPAPSQEQPLAPAPHEAAPVSGGRSGTGGGQGNPS
jgi:sec-independent protein translocase protein TatA